MGAGYALKCPKCDFTHTYQLGIGYLFPMDYENTVQNAKEGGLGNELKSFFAENPYGAIDAEYVLLCCSECGSYETRKDLTMYLPTKRNREDIPRCVTRDELKLYYTVYQKYPHRCEKCGGSMSIVRKGREIREKLLCPNCRSVLENDFEMCWD